MFVDMVKWNKLKVVAIAMLVIFTSVLWTMTGAEAGNDATSQKSSILYKLFGKEKEQEKVTSSPDDAEAKKIPLPSWEFYQGMIGDVFLRTSGAEMSDKEQKKTKGQIILLYSKGTEKGCPYSMAKLAMLYAEGMGEYKDMNKALELAKKSADMDCALGHWTLGIFYLEGKNYGIKQDTVAGEEHLARAAHLGALRDANVTQQFYGGSAAYELARFLNNPGKARARDRESAILFFQISVDMNKQMLKTMDKLKVKQDPDSNEDTVFMIYENWAKQDLKNANKKIAELENSPDFSYTDPYPVVKAYVDNEIAADLTYKDKIIRIRGEIGEIRRAHGGDICVEFTPPNILGFKTVYCYFKEYQVNEVAKLRRFEYATIQGKCIGMDVGVVLTECKIIQSH